MTSKPKPKPEDLRRWAENHRAAVERERVEIRGGAYVEDPIKAGLGLIALAARLHGWPIPRAAVGQREDEAKWEAWARLREGLARQ